MEQISTVEKHLWVFIWGSVFMVLILALALAEGEKRLGTLEFTSTHQEEAILTQDVKIRELHKELSEERELRKKYQANVASMLTNRGGSRRVLATLTGFEVTWYNDKGATRSGRDATPGVSVAVDPAIIELGTWLEIELPNGQKLIRRADDTGSAVKGKIIDIHSDASTKTLMERGRNVGVTVRILNGGV
jgi:3D (Asp-Asp-Asp) domain-containing protein